MADDDNWLGLSDEEGGALPPAPTTSRPQSEAPEAAAQRPAPLEAAAVVPRVVPSGLFGNNGEGGYPPGALRQKAQVRYNMCAGLASQDHTFDALAAWHIFQGFGLGPMKLLMGHDINLVPRAGAKTLRRVPASDHSTQR